MKRTKAFWRRANNDRHCLFLNGHRLAVVYRDPGDTADCWFVQVLNREIAFHGPLHLAKRAARSDLNHVQGMLEGL